MKDILMISDGGIVARMTMPGFPMQGPCALRQHVAKCCPPILSHSWILPHAGTTRTKAMRCQVMSADSIPFLDPPPCGDHAH